MSSISLKRYIEKEANKASRKIILLVLIIGYAIYLAFATYMSQYKVKVVTDANADTIVQLVSIGDINRLKNISRSYIAKGITNAIWITQSNSGYLIDYFSDESLADKEKGFENTISVVDGKPFLVNERSLSLGKHSIATIKTATAIPVLSYLAGFVFIFLTYLIASYLLRKQFGQMGLKIAEPLSEFHQILNYSQNKTQITKKVQGSYKEIEDIAERHSQMLDEIQKKQKIEEEAKASKAVARTVKELAHDVRKPFTILEGVLKTLKGKNVAPENETFVRESIDEIKQALVSVNGMIDDVMSVGADQEIKPEVCSLVQLIERSLKDIFSYDKGAKIDFQFSFKHKHHLYAQPLKIIRVISNVVANANQAMSRKGKIWFHSSEIEVDDKLMLELSIGNSNSYIPANEIENLFDMFYTKDKANGTGLGLAIVKQVVRAHGGDVRCQSSKEAGTEFIITLPLAPSEDQKLDLAYSSSSDLLAEGSLELKTSDSRSSEIDDSEISKKLVDLLTYSRPLRIMAVDDDKFFRDLVEMTVANDSSLKSKIEIRTYATGQEALSKVMEFNPDLTLMDIDLNNEEMNGIDAIKALRGMSFKEKICIHSNRGTFELQEQLVEIGADFMIPKPISKSQLFKMLISIVKKNPENFAKSDYDGKHIIVLDDSKILLSLWEMNVDMKQYRYLKPEDFFEAIKKDESIINNALCVVTDYIFDKDDSGFNGVSFAEKLKSLYPDVPIYLSTDYSISEDEMKGFIDGVINKDAEVAWQQAKRHLNV